MKSATRGIPYDQHSHYFVNTHLTPDPVQPRVLPHISGRVMINVELADGTMLGCLTDSYVVKPDGSVEIKTNRIGTPIGSSGWSKIEDVKSASILTSEGNRFTLFGDVNPNMFKPVDVEIDPEIDVVNKENPVDSDSDIGVEENSDVEHLVEPDVVVQPQVILDSIYQPTHTPAPTPVQESRRVFNIDDIE